VTIKPRHQLLEDLIKASKKHPTGWKAAIGKDYHRFSNDYYIFHPDIGVYLLKEYQKNPILSKGIGMKLARNIDEDIHEKIHKNADDFGIIQGNIQKIIQNIHQGIPPQHIFQEALKGNDLGIQMPLKGKANSSLETFNQLKNNYKEQQQKLNKKFEHLASQDGLYHSYR
jgi:hypothetical protein